MTDYSKLVEALRYCVNARDCKKCAYRINNNSVKCRIQRVENAADAIEALQAEVMRLNMRCADCEYAASEWPEDPGHTKTPKRGEWVRKEDELAFWYECSECGYRPHSENYPYLSDFCPNCGAKMEVQDG